MNSKPTTNFSQLVHDIRMSVMDLKELDPEHELIPLSKLFLAKKGEIVFFEGFLEHYPIGDDLTGEDAVVSYWADVEDVVVERREEAENALVTA